jgi:hypothetical protein
MQLLPHENDSMSALPELSSAGHVDEHVVVVVMIDPEDAVLVVMAVVLLGVTVAVLVEFEQATSAIGGFAATPMGEKTAPVSCGIS